jgi:phospholipid/cholesterol/gamma-HCH transport system substrate-binding protein
MRRTPGTRRVAVALEHRVLGVTFLSLLALFVWLTYAIFNKTFTDYVDVTLRASRTGLQLPNRADVKVRGMVVGAVVDRKVTTGGAVLTLGLFPGRLALIPANVTARILPKTLFGEKYVALQVPADPAGESIRAGDVIRESKVAIEVQKVLRDFYPLLRTVQPAQLSYTLTSIADALEGRGEALGHNLVVLDDYLRRMNPQVPQLVEDLGKLASVSDTYSQVLPQVAQILRNSVVTGRTFVDREQKVKALFDDVAAFSSTSRAFLVANGDNIIRLSRLGQEQLPTYAKYAPEYPCLLQGLVGQVPGLDQIWRGHMLHINLETLPKQPTGYGPQDSPVYGANNPPDCASLPTPPYSQANPTPQPPMSAIDDGVESGHGKFRRRAAPGYAYRPAPADPQRGLAGLLVGPLGQGVPR